MNRIAFISCVKTKADRPLPAKDLYISPWFRMAKEYARRNSDRWFILSAAEGLLHPDRVTDPYDMTLNDQAAWARKDWAHFVKQQMDRQRLAGSTAIVLAGTNYREFLMPAFRLRFNEVVVPMKGLMMGQQLSWMKNKLGG
jgi:hypothetical protein